uniref:Cation/H+ exchanger domain-containing protein n=1 Tax=Oryza brachyantha TaxID=4533 RepID=J3NAX4_ORYBR
MAATMVTDPLAELWNHTMSTDRTDLMCFYPSKITMGGIWVGDNPLDFSMPLLLFQVLLITSTTRAATLLLSPLRLPRYISEILAGFLLGPSVLGRLPHFSDLVFPIRSLFVLESLALFGLVYYTFIVGVEIEVPTITNAGLRSFGFAAGKITMGGVWVGDNPLDFSMPLLLFQVLLITSTTRAATLLLSPLRLPRYISEILAGFLLGPSVLGRLPHFSDLVFPIRSLFVLESLALFGLVYYTFIVGVEIEVPTITNAGVRNFGFAAGCALPPFLVGAVTGYVALSTDDRRKGDTFLNRLSFPIFLGATFSSTAFSVLARTIAELKLAGTDAGLTVATALKHTQSSLLQTTWTLTSGVAIFGVSYLLVRPMLLRLARRAAEGEVVGEVRECSVLIGVMVAALVADAGGTHAIFGAFVFGLAVPNGPVGVALVEKVEDFVVGLLLPLFFALSGLRTDTAKITSVHAAVLLMVAAMLAAVFKVAAAVGVAGVFGMPLSDGTSIGLLLNTKGIIELVILNIARNKGIMSDQSFTVLVFMSALITAMVSPLLAMVVKPARIMSDQSFTVLVFKSVLITAMNAEGVSARTMAAVSPYVSMHEDITSAAENLHSALILLPFHKHRSVDGGMGVSHPAIQPLNGSVLRFSPCTVGILVDRGLAAVPGAGYRVVALFFGGSDDRFTASEFDALKERKADDGCLREFLDRANEGGGATVEYRERGVFNANEMVAEIQNVEAMGNKDLFVVGKAYGRPAVVGAVSVDLGGESVAPTERSASGRRPWARSAP